MTTPSPNAAPNGDVANGALRASGMPILDEALAQLWRVDQESLIAIADIAAERVRQVTAEGWSPAHDNSHLTGELALAASCYAAAGHYNSFQQDLVPPPGMWPWHRDWWKPKSRHRNNVRAGALLIAEIARHYRSANP